MKEWTVTVIHSSTSVTRYFNVKARNLDRAIAEAYNLTKKGEILQYVDERVRSGQNGVESGLIGWLKED